MALVAIARHQKKAIDYSDREIDDSVTKIVARTVSFARPDHLLPYILFFYIWKGASIAIEIHGVGGPTICNGGQTNGGVQPHEPGISPIK